MVIENQSRDDYVRQMEGLARKAFEAHVVSQGETDVDWRIRRPAAADQTQVYWTNVFHIAGYVGAGGDIQLVVWPALTNEKRDVFEFIADGPIDYIASKIVAGPTEHFDRGVAHYEFAEGFHADTTPRIRKKVLALLAAGAPKELVWQEAGTTFGMVPHPAIFYAREAIRLVATHRRGRP